MSESSYKLCIHASFSTKHSEELPDPPAREIAVGQAIEEPFSVILLDSVRVVGEASNSKIVCVGKQKY